MIHFTAITPDNWRRFPLQVTPEQASHVADRVTLLARAYAYRNFRSHACLICEDETPVGMILYHDSTDDEEDCYVLSQLFIDARYQGKGYGRQATALALEEMRADGRYGKVILCYTEGNEAAKNLYESFGFVETDRDEDEIIMELTL